MNKSDLIQILAEVKFAACQPRPADGVCKAVNSIADRYNLSDEEVETAVADMYRKHHPIRPTSAEEFFSLVNNITENYKRANGIE